MEMVNFFDLKCKSDIRMCVYIVCSWTDQHCDIIIRIILHGMLKTTCVIVSQKSLLSAKMCVCLCVHQSMYHMCYLKHYRQSVWNNYIYSTR